MWPLPEANATQNELSKRNSHILTMVDASANILGVAATLVSREDFE